MSFKPFDETADPTAEHNRLSALYETRLAAYREHPSPETKRPLTAVGEQLHAAREFWRGIGTATGTRTFVAITEE